MFEEGHLRARAIIGLLRILGTYLKLAVAGHWAASRADAPADCQSESLGAQMKLLLPELRKLQSRCRLKTPANRSGPRRHSPVLRAARSAWQIHWRCLARKEFSVPYRFFR